MMQRKQFIRNSLLAGGSLAATSIIRAKGIANSPDTADQPFKLNYAVHDGMFKNSAGDDFIAQIQFAHDRGFRSIEDNGMCSRPPEQQKKIGDALAKLGMGMGVFVLNK